MNKSQAVLDWCSSEEGKSGMAASAACISPKAAAVPIS